MPRVNNDISAQARTRTKTKQVRREREEIVVNDWSELSSARVKRLRQKDPYAPIILAKEVRRTRATQSQQDTPKTHSAKAAGVALCVALSLATAIAIPLHKFWSHHATPQATNQPAPATNPPLPAPITASAAPPNLTDGRPIASGFNILPTPGATTAPTHYPTIINVEGDYIANGVNYSNLLSDAEFTDWRSLNQHDLQAYFVSTNSFLATYKEGKMPASAIIANAARRHRINPKVILATLEKESTLVTQTKQPAREVLMACMGYGFPDDPRARARVVHVSGFGFQVEHGTRLLRQLYDRAGDNTFPTPKTVDYGQRRIRVHNRATLALFEYTPHTRDTHLNDVGGGNFGFRKWFTRIAQAARHHGRYG